MKGPLPARPQRDSVLALAALPLALITGCAGTGAARPRIETLPPQPPAPASSDAPAEPAIRAAKPLTALTSPGPFA